MASFYLIYSSLDVTIPSIRYIEDIDCMKFTLSWLKRFIRTNSSTHDIVDALNKIGLEVESITDKSEEYKGFKVAEIKARSQHPDADKLSVCTVYDGKEMLQIVCGAPNARAGIKVVLAEIGAVVPNGKFAIKKKRYEVLKAVECFAQQVNCFLVQTLMGL